MKRVGVILAALVVGLLSTLPTNAKFDGDAANRESRPYTVDLPPVDKIEVRELNVDDNGEVYGIAATRTLVGTSCQKLADLWRRQDYDWHFAAACFEPAYAVLFWSKGKLIVEGQICFDCTQIHFTREATKGTIRTAIAFEGFNGFTPQARDLKARLERLFPKKDASP